MPCHYIIHCGWNVHWTPRNNGPIRNKVKYNIFVHPKKVGRGHGNVELVSVHLLAWLSIQGFWPSTPKKLGGDMGMVSLWASICRPDCPSRVSDHYLRIIQFGAALVQFYQSFGEKFMNMAEIYGFQWLSRKIVAQSTSNLECTLVWWTSRIDSLLECIGPISAICCQKITENGDFFTII